MVRIFYDFSDPTTVSTVLSPSKVAHKFPHPYMHCTAHATSSTGFESFSVLLQIKNNSLDRDFSQA